MLESQADQTFLFCIYYLVVHYDGIKEKNKTNQTELPILAQRLRPRTLDPVTHARISGGPNFFDFSFIYYVVIVRYNRIKEKEQLILT